MKVIPTFALDSLQLGLHLLAKFQVERPERFVEKEDFRLVHDRPRECNPLALATRKLERLALAEAGEPDHLQHSLRSCAPIRLRNLADLEAILDVLDHRHVGEQRIVLEDGVHVARIGRLPGHVDAPELNGAAVGPFEARDDP